MDGSLEGMVFTRRKVAFTLRGADMIIVCGFVVPVTSPLQAEIIYPLFAKAES